MCGIVVAVSDKNICDMLLNGLNQLEYRGYDSAGIALINGGIQRVRRIGRVADLSAALKAEPRSGNIGIAHTRWATHGAPDEANAHPHISNDRVVVVHNGIIENYEMLKQQQLAAGFSFESETDTEVIAHQIMLRLNKGGDLLTAVRDTLSELEGAYALSVLDAEHPESIVLARKGSPLIIGIGDDGNYAASDIQAMLSITREFIYLQNNDIARISRSDVTVFDSDLNVIERERCEVPASQQAVEMGGFDHFMQKEIHEQPRAVADTLEGRFLDDMVPEEIISADFSDVLDKVRAVEIVACGTSSHAGMVARYWFEELANIHCTVEIASEYRYRKQVINPDTLFVAISQSGETADTLAATHLAAQQGYLATLAICNVAESSLVRDTDHALMTHAGPEIGVASTKAFTTQLVSLLLLVILIGRHNGMSDEMLESLVAQLRNLPTRLEQALSLESEIKTLAQEYADKHHALFLGRGQHYPIAMEGALKMKEISYIHAEAYAAGELKHGPLALVDRDMPVVVVAPNDHLLEKLKSNLQEVQARGGKLYVFAETKTNLRSSDNVNIIQVDAQENTVAPIIFTIPLQLLAYHTALLKGTDIDKPRNLAKSVTVE